jgi:hypothetical protein
MANRYWVGGDGTWNTTSTTNWSATDGGAAGASAPTTADSVFFNANSNVGTTAFTVTLGSSVGCLSYTSSALDAIMILNLGSFTLTVAGSWSNELTNFNITGTSSAIINFTPPAATTRTITTSGYTFPQITIRITAAASTGSLRLSGALTLVGFFDLVAGNLNLNGFTLTPYTFDSSNSNLRSITFGAANIVLNSNTAGTTVLYMLTATNFTWTGTGGFVRNQRSTATFRFGDTAGFTTANAPNLTFNSVTSTQTFGSNSGFKNLNFGTSSCSVQNTNTSFPIYIVSGGSVTLSSTGSYSSFYPYFQGTATLDTTATNRTLHSLGIGGTGSTVTLASNVSIGSGGTGNSTFLDRGTLNLNGFNLTTSRFNSNNSNTRAIAFGSGSIIIIGTQVGSDVCSMATATNFTWTGTGGFVRNQTANVVFVFGTTGGTASNAPNLTVNAGASTLTITTGSWFKNVNFTGSTCTVLGTTGGTFAINIAGNLTLATGGTYTAMIPTFVGSSTVTSSGKPISITTVNGSGITVTLAGALTPSAFTLTNGTLNLNGFNLSTSGSFSIGVGTKNITFNGGTISLSSATTSAWLNSNPTGFTTTAGTGVGTISMTAATAKSFQGGGSTYNCTVNQGGAGALTITGSNTFDNITNTVQPASVLFTAGTTNTFNSFSLSGTSGNLVTIGSVTAASHTLSKASGTVSVSFCSISYSTATGGAIWEAATGNGNVDAGNNTGWIFSGGSILADISELITVSDLLEGIYTTFSLVNEQVSLQDTLSSIYTTDSSLSESTSLTDSLSPTYDGFVVCTDAISLTDSLSATYSTFVACTDSISLTDSLASTYSTFVACTDSISLTDSLSATSTMLVVCVDSISLTDSLSVIYDGIVFSTENVAVSDSPSATANMSVAVQDSVNTLSIPSSRFPWDLVQDNPEAIWRVIQTFPDVE